MSPFCFSSVYISRQKEFHVVLCYDWKINHDSTARAENFRRIYFSLCTRCRYTTKKLTAKSEKTLHIETFASTQKSKIMASNTNVEVNVKCNLTVEVFATENKARKKHDTIGSLRPMMGPMTGQTTSVYMYLLPTFKNIYCLNPVMTEKIRQHKINI